MSFVVDTIRDFFGGSERDAAEIQAQSGNEAIQELRAAREQAREDVAPFRSAGEGALDPLRSLVIDFDPSVERENIVRDVQRTAAARGKLHSGGTLLELGRQLYGFQQRNRAQRFSELFNLATLGANAASNQATATLNTGASVADTTTGIGNARAAGRVGAANRTQGTLQSILGIVLGG